MCELKVFVELKVKHTADLEWIDVLNVAIRLRVCREILEESSKTELVQGGTTRQKIGVDVVTYRRLMLMKHSAP